MTVLLVPRMEGQFAIRERRRKMIRSAAWMLYLDSQMSTEPKGERSDAFRFHQE